MKRTVPYDYPEIIHIHVDPKVVFVTLGQFLEIDIPERKFLLAPWLPEQGLAMVCAPRGIGKTFFGLTVTYAVASGSSFLGWQLSHSAMI
ncbi:MAG: AAA family ATPase [Porticoccus sp.]|nr:AAA family ATPase [Porticoccus sp.]